MGRIHWMGVIGLFWISFYWFCSYILTKERVVAYIKPRQWLHPNSICYFRVVMGWIGLFIYFKTSYHDLGIFVYTGAAVLDGVDGLVARSCQLESQLGAWIDAACDKATYLPALYFQPEGMLSPELFKSLVMVELFGQFLVRELQRCLGWKVDANRWGKIKTMLCFSLVIYCALLQEYQVANITRQMQYACLIFAITSVAFKFITQAGYVRFLILADLLCGILGIGSIAYYPNYFWLISLMVIGQILMLFDGRFPQSEHGSDRVAGHFDSVVNFISLGVCPALWYIVQGSVLSGMIYGATLAYRLFCLRYRDQPREGVIFGLPSSVSGLLALGIWPVVGEEHTVLQTAGILMICTLTISSITFAHLGRIILSIKNQAITVIPSATIVVVLAYASQHTDLVVIGTVLTILVLIYALTARLILKPRSIF